MMTQLSGSGEVLVREAVPSSDTVRERFAAVDGLRALAILAVLLYEAFVFVPALAGGNVVLARALDDASQGFALFLLLSGFTLGYPAIVAFTESKRAYLDLARFAIKRVLRIYPAYLFALVLAFALPPLALRYGLPALTGSARPAAISDIVRMAFFAGDGLGNDGFQALAFVARLYVFFPLLLLLWSRSALVFAGVGLALAVLDATTGLHAVGLGAFVPFMLGILAATVRAQNLPAYRFGIPLALLAGAAAVAFGPALAHAAAGHGPAGTLRIDPLWSLALFGCLVSVTAIEPFERLCAFAPLRLLGAASFAISLVVVPVTAFAVRQLATTIGPIGAAANAIVASIVVGFVLWKLVDRSFSDGDIRRGAADAFAPKLASLLARVRADRVVLGRAPAVVFAEIEPETPHVESSFYAPPPRPDAGDLAIVSKRTGSPDELAAEILATKKRLAERSAAIFAEPKPVTTPVVYQKPGFYRRPTPKALGTSQHVAIIAPPKPVELESTSARFTTAVAPAMPLLNTLPVGVHDGAVGRPAGSLAKRSPIKMRFGAARLVPGEFAMSDERLDG